MISIANLKHIHLEITNKCNSRCPGCARTHQGDTHPDLKPLLMEWSLDHMKNFFKPNIINNKFFTLGGVVDEPLMNKNILSIVEYILEHDGEIEIYSNTGANTEKVWETLGNWSRETKRLHMKFSVDGLEHTNHLYRVNVDWNKVIKNMTAYAKTKGDCEWQYHVFKHNESDIPEAKKLSDSLNIPITLRQNVRNIKPWTSYIKKKVNGKIVEQQFTVDPTDNKDLAHPETQKVADWKDTAEVTEQEKARSITCKMLHEGEIFVDWSGRVFPCCWFASDYFFDHETHLKEVDIEYGNNWNSLHHHDLEDILSHEYYSKLLYKSWMRGNKFFSPECFKKCGDLGARRSYLYTPLE